MDSNTRRPPEYVSDGRVLSPSGASVTRVTWLIERSFKKICRWPTPGPVPPAYAPSASNAITFPLPPMLGLSGLPGPVVTWVTAGGGTAGQASAGPGVGFWQS